MICPPGSAFYDRAIRLKQRAIACGNQIVIDQQDRIIPTLALRIKSLETSEMDGRLSVDDVLLKEQRPVNFKTVAETAGISTAWLYGNEALKQRIMHLRAKPLPAVQVKIPPREQASSASKDAMIAALRQRVKKLEEQNRDLKRQVEVANGLLYQQG
jgi:hypothetical protein